MLCAESKLLVTCGNTTGTNCTSKVQSTALVLKSSTICAPSDLVVLTNTEVQQIQQYSPFALSLSEGSIIGAAIIAVWATAWGIKALVQTLGSGEPER